MLYFDFENNNAKSAADSKSSVGKLAGAKAKFMAKWTLQKPEPSLKRLLSVRCQARVQDNGQVEEIEYISELKGFVSCAIKIICE